MIAMTQPWGYFIFNFVTAISQIILDNEQLCLISYFYLLRVLTHGIMLIFTYVRIYRVIILIKCAIYQFKTFSRFCQIEKKRYSFVTSLYLLVRHVSQPFLWVINSLIYVSIPKQHSTMFYQMTPRVSSVVWPLQITDNIAF